MIECQNYKCEIPVDTECTLIVEQAKVFDEDICDMGEHSDIIYYCNPCWNKISEILQSIQYE